MNANNCYCNQRIIPRINLFKNGSRLHVHGRNCLRSAKFKTGSLCSIQSSNLRPLRSSFNNGSFAIGINGLILNKLMIRIRYNKKHTFHKLFSMLYLLRNLVHDLHNKQ